MLGENFGVDVPFDFQPMPLLTRQESGLLMHPYTCFNMDFTHALARDLLRTVPPVYDHMLLWCDQGGKCSGSCKL